MNFYGVTRYPFTNTAIPTPIYQIKTSPRHFRIRHCVPKKNLYSANVVILQITDLPFASTLEKLAEVLYGTVPYCTGQYGTALV